MCEHPQHRAQYNKIREFVWGIWDVKTLWFIIVKAEKNVFTLQNANLVERSRCVRSPTTTIPLKFNCLKNHQKKTNAKIFSLDTRSTLTFWCRRQIIDAGRQNLKLKRKQHFFSQVYYCRQQMWLLLWHGCVAIAKTHEKHIFDEFLSLNIFNTQIPSAEKKEM